jgi:pimeloyl-ACP methyl ester carboxylesterase
MMNSTAAVTSHMVEANGTAIYYEEQGHGEPLLLLHGGLVSTSAVWNGSPVAWVSHMDALAQHFRVIAPDTRGHGRTANRGGGPVLYDCLADDVVALIAALGLERPLLCGFSDGGAVATVVGIRQPGLARAIVNYAGYDTFNPDATSFSMARQLFGGSPDATRADPAAVERWLESSDELRAMFAAMKADHDNSQGAGSWETLLAESFGRWTQPSGYTFGHFGRITAPTLILAGDRDHLCSPEGAASAYRRLPAGELAILPNTGHWISAQGVQIAVDFLRRHATI